MDINFREVIERADMQNLSAFLLYGKGSGKVNYESHNKRLKDSLYTVINMIEKKFPSIYDNDSLKETVYLAIGEYIDVFIELGLQTGMKLAAQILVGRKDSI